MLQSEASQKPVDGLTANEPLPLFRSEALQAPERFYGEILRIRPFSWAFLGWVAGGFVVAVAGILVFLRR
jgi:hypothetical protein